MDDDLKAMSEEELREEVLRLREAIRDHRDRRGHDLCWHVPELWGLLPEGVGEVQPLVPERGEFIRRCEQYRASFDPQPRDGPDLGSTFYMAEMEAAASRIIAKMEDKGIELLCLTCVTWDVMLSRIEQDGMLNLIWTGHLDGAPGTPEPLSPRVVFPTQKMLEKLRGKLGDQPWLRWKDPMEGLA